MNRGKPDIRTVRRAMSNRPSHRASAMNATPMMRIPIPGANGVDASPTRSIIIARTKTARIRGAMRRRRVARAAHRRSSARESQPTRRQHDALVRRRAREIWPIHQETAPQRHDRGRERRLAPQISTNATTMTALPSIISHAPPGAPAIQHQRAEAAGERGDVGPPAPQRDRALETDDRAEESSHHERAVKRDERRRAPGSFQPSRTSAAGERANERDATERQDGEAARDHVHPSCSRAASDIIDGCHTGSHTRSTETEVTPPTCCRITVCACRTIDSPSGHAADVIVMTTWTCSPCRRTLVRQAEEFHHVDADLGIDDAAKRYADLVRARRHSTSPSPQAGHRSSGSTGGTGGPRRPRGSGSASGGCCTPSAWPSWDRSSSCSSSARR